MEIAKKTVLLVLSSSGASFALGLVAGLLIAFIVMYFAHKRHKN